jgi:hypothetical protein
LGNVYKINQYILGRMPIDKRFKVVYTTNNLTKCIFIMSPDTFILILVAILVLILGIENPFHVWAARAEIRR